MRRRGIILGVLLTLAIVEHTIGKHSVVLHSRQSFQMRPTSRLVKALEMEMGTAFVFSQTT